MIFNTSIGTDLNRKHLNKVNDLFTENLKIAFYNVYFKQFSHLSMNNKGLLFS